MTINSTQFYTSLQSTFAEVEEKLKEAGVEGRPRITIWAGSFEKGIGNFHISISNDTYGSDEVKVEGKSLEDCITEFIRRSQFQQRQKNLQIGAPSIDL